MNQHPEDKTSDLKSAVQQTVKEERLSDEQLQGLMDMQDTMIPTDQSFEGTPKKNEELSGTETQSNKFGSDEAMHLTKGVKSHWGSIAASVALAVCISLMLDMGWGLSGNKQAPGTETDYSRQIALEVVANHIKLKPLDVNTSSMDGIREYFDQLDFSPARSSVLDQAFDLSDGLLLGGRYCSIKGGAAAQIRYAPEGLESDIRSTLYQVGYDEQLYGQMPDIDNGENIRQLAVQGLDVAMWQEKGLLMVLVTAPK